MGSRGVTLVVVIFVTTIVLLLGTALINMSTNEYLMGSYARDYTAAYYLAESGIQKALAILKDNPAGQSRESTPFGIIRPLGAVEKSRSFS